MLILRLFIQNQRGNLFFMFLYVFIPVLIIVLLFQKKSTGAELMEKIHCQLDIIEKDYFGLQYTDSNNIGHWLDPTKLVKKQVKSKLIYNFQMFVDCIKQLIICTLFEKYVCLFCIHISSRKVRKGDGTIILVYKIFTLIFKL